MFSGPHSHLFGIIIQFYGAVFPGKRSQACIIGVIFTACANSKITDNANNTSLIPMANKASDQGNGNVPVPWVMCCPLTQWRVVCGS